MDILNYRISLEGENYIYERIKKSKRDIFIATGLTIILAVLFVGIKTDFYQSTIKPPAIIAGISMLFFGGFSMIYANVRRYLIMKQLVKEIQIDSEGSVKLSSFSGQVVSISKEKAKIYEGYEGNVKLKNIFDETTYRIEGYTEGLIFYFVCTYWEDWDIIKERLEN